RASWVPSSRRTSRPSWKSRIAWQNSPRGCTARISGPRPGPSLSACSRRSCRTRRTATSIRARNCKCRYRIRCRIKRAACSTCFPSPPLPPTTNRASPANSARRPGPPLHQSAGRRGPNRLLVFTRCAGCLPSRALLPAEWAVFRQLYHVFLDEGGLALQKVCNGGAEYRIVNPVRRPRLYRQHAACELVLALGTAFEHLNSVRDGVLDPLDIARLEMQARHELRAAPVAAVEPIAVADVQGGSNGLPV